MSYERWKTAPNIIMLTGYYNRFAETQHLWTSEEWSVTVARTAVSMCECTETMLWSGRAIKHFQHIQLRHTFLSCFELGTSTIHPFIHLVHPFIRSSISSPQSFIRSSVHPFCHLSRSSVHPFIRFHSSVHPFDTSFIQPFIRSGKPLTQHNYFHHSSCWSDQCLSCVHGEAAF